MVKNEFVSEVQSWFPRNHIKQLSAACYSRSKGLAPLLERMQGKGDTYTLLVWMKTSSPTKEISMKHLQETKNKPCNPAIAYRMTIRLTFSVLVHCFHSILLFFLWEWKCLLCHSMREVHNLLYTCIFIQNSR